MESHVQHFNNGDTIDEEDEDDLCGAESSTIDDEEDSYNTSTYMPHQHNHQTSMNNFNIQSKFLLSLLSYLFMC